ncbi:MAG: TIGR02680 family protein [Solirubrobacteraceae bacterium]
MTDQLFGTGVAAQPPVDAPVERFDRWVLHRAGIVNVWQYDQAELLFAGGRVLLRGRNGAGKSKALEVLLPLLLDGDTRAIDAAARDRTTVYWLMTDGREPGNHVGYAWLELRLSAPGAEDRFLTLGAGLKAATSSHSASSWFFVADAHRVGADLILGPDVSADKLKELLGADAVTSSAAEHRRRVGVQLFGLTDEIRYGNLLRLLRTLRDPNIGNKIEAGELARVLGDALPPPSDTALQMAAERFDDLDQIREQLARVRRTSAALSRFLDTYRGYAATVLRSRAGAVIDAEGARRSRERASSGAAAREAEAGTARRHSETQEQALTDQREHAQRELEGLRQSDAYKDHLSLVDRQNTVAAIGVTADNAEQQAQTLAGVADGAQTNAEEASNEAARRADAVRDARPPMLALAGAAGIDRTVIPEDSPDTIPNAVSVSSGRRRAAEQVRTLSQEASAARQRAAQADEQAARSETDLAKRTEETAAARERWVSVSQAWRADVRAWARPQVVLASGLDFPADAVERTLGEGGAEADELEAVRAGAIAAMQPLQEAAREAEARAATAVNAAEQALTERSAERDALAAEEEARPSRSRFQVSERDPDGGAPLYELVEVEPNLSPAAKAGLEAGLEASGLLDAWVSAEGVLLHPATQDVILGAGITPLPDVVPTLADVLTSPRTELSDVLRGVGWGDPRKHGGDPGAHPWVSADGRWSLGPIRGLWSKERSEYLGAGARRETRQRRLEQLDRQVSEAGRELDAARHSLEQRGADARTLDQHARNVPEGREVTLALTDLQGRLTLQSEVALRHGEDRSLAERARTVAAQAQAEVAHAAGRNGLPTEIEPLEAIIAAAGDLERDLRAWQGMWDEALKSTHAAQRAGNEADNRRDQASEAADKALAARKRHREEQDALRSLQEAVGASTAQVLASIETWTQRGQQAKDALPAAKQRVNEAAAAHGSAKEAAKAAEQAVFDAEATLQVMHRRLRRTLAIPGLLEAATGHMEPETEADATPESAPVLARRVSAAVGDGEPVSDQTVLNRANDLEDGLAGGYDVIWHEDDGVKHFEVADDSGRQPLPRVAARIAAEAAAAADRLIASEREVIERFLLGELGEELRDRLLEAHDLVASANAALAGQRTSHGIGAHLDWRIDEDAPELARSAADILVKSPRSADEDASLRDALMEMIAGRREKEPEAGYLQHLRAALDYRNWYRFTVKVVNDAQPGKIRNLHPRLGLSQGEQRVISYLALFAAAAAYYDGIGGDCPRLLLLDDAFAKVDEPTHGRLLRLLVDMNLDFIITSERMWGCFPEIPSLEIYEALREPSTPGVALVHFHWDGKTRHLVGV